MRNFNQTSSQRGGSRFGSGNRGGSRFGNDRGPVTMHNAICSECHKECQVPFRPTGDKPIYCNDCFGANRGNDRFPRKDFGSRPSFSGSAGNDEVKKQLEFLGLKIDRLTKAVENLSATKTNPSKEKSAEVKKVLNSIPAKKVAKKKVTKKIKV